MTEELFELYDALLDKQDGIDSIIRFFGGDLNGSYLYDQIEQLKLMIVKAYGGNKEHYKHIDSTWLFADYETKRTHENKKELIDYIQLTIQENFTNEVQCELKLR